MANDEILTISGVAELLKLRPHAGVESWLGPRGTASTILGAESTIYFLLPLLEMLELAGEGLEHASRFEGTEA